MNTCVSVEAACYNPFVFDGFFVPLKNKYGGARSHGVTRRSPAAATIAVASGGSCNTGAAGVIVLPRACTHTADAADLSVCSVLCTVSASLIQSSLPSSRLLTSSSKGRLAATDLVQKSGSVGEFVVPVSGSR